MSVDQIIEPILEPTAKEITKTFQNNSEYLKRAAGNFLAGIRKAIKDYSNILVLTQKAKTGTQASLQTIYNSMKENTQITQECIRLQYNFEKALNAFLGRQIYLLYVTQDGTLLYANEVKAAKIYRTAQKKADGKGVIANLDTSKLESFPKKISKNFQQILQKRQNLYTPIQDEVIRRWTQNHNSENTWVKRNPKHLDTFYWLKGIQNGEKKWDWSKQMNRGHIYEAYASLIWQEESLLKFDPNAESDIEKYWIYMANHGILNSVAGVVKGDVSFFLNPAIQFAVKSGSFNTAAMGPYIDVAYQLYYGTIEINKEMVYALLNNLNSYKSAVREKGLKIAEEKLNNFIKNFNKA